MNDYNETALAMKENIEPASLSIIERGRALMPVTVEDCELSGKIVRECTAQITRVKDYFKKPKADAKLGHTNMCNMERDALEGLEDVKEIAQTRASDALNEIDRVKQVEANKEAERLEEQRKKDLEDANKKIANQLRSAKTDAEKLNKLGDILIGNLDGITDIEVEAMQAECEVLRARLENKTEKIMDIREEVAAPVQTVTHVKETKVKGLRRSTEYDVAIVNPGALVKAIANPDHAAPIGLVKQFDETLIKTLFKSGIKLPGVSVKTRRL